jgi:hypothetical protein
MNTSTDDRLFNLPTEDLLMITQPPQPRRVISLFPKAIHPPERTRVAAFVDLDEVFCALESLAPKREPTRAEWLAALAARSPRELAGQR